MDTLILVWLAFVTVLLFNAIRNMKVIINILESRCRKGTVRFGVAFGLPKNKKERQQHARRS